MEREWWQPPNPMGGLLGSGVRGAGLVRPAIPPRLPPEPLPASKAEPKAEPKATRRREHLADAWLEQLRARIEADGLRATARALDFHPDTLRRAALNGLMAHATVRALESALLREVPPVVGPGKVLEASTPASSAPREPVALRPAPAGIQPGTIRGIILRAACELAAGSTLTRIALAAVVVRAWRLDTARLGLRGYEELHPDANRVYAKLSGTEGLVELGLLERTGFGVVSVTRKGLAWWRGVQP